MNSIDNHTKRKSPGWVPLPPRAGVTRLDYTVAPPQGSWGTLVWHTDYDAHVCTVRTWWLRHSGDAYGTHPHGATREKDVLPFSARNTDVSHFSPFDPLAHLILLYSLGGHRTVLHIHSFSEKLISSLKARWMCLWLLLSSAPLKVIHQKKDISVG